METKKIFVLGNGFDLAHYLPTAYIHFMEAMQVVENSHTSSELGFDDLSSLCSTCTKPVKQKGGYTAFFQ